MQPVSAQEDSGPSPRTEAAKWRSPGEFRLPALVDAETLRAAVRAASVAPQEPAEAGVYFLLRQGEIVYIGQSTNVPARVRQHALRRDFDAFAYVRCARDDADELEVWLTRLLVPSLNAKRADGRVLTIRRGYAKRATGGTPRPVVRGRCRALTGAGFRCQNGAPSGDLCGFHERYFSRPLARAMELVGPAPAPRP